MVNPSQETLETTEVLIIGAGPTGLALANLLGQRGIQVMLADERTETIAYPRAVGIDDDSLRLMQQIGIIEEIRPHIIEHHSMRILNGKGKELAHFNAPGKPNGYTRKNAFHQGEIDTAMAQAALANPNVDFRLGVHVEDFAQDADAVTAKVGNSRVRAGWVVSCEGGRASLRKWLGVNLEGTTEPTRWLVADVDNDPVGTPGGILGADPKRPYVSICLPHNLRRFEFLLRPEETLTEELVHELIQERVGGRSDYKLVRYREFSHHSRMAQTYRVGRCLLAGDSAHLMPVWLGQGMNSGLRDAANLAWKLAGVVRGHYREDILDTYEQERRTHAQAMVDQSTLVGHVVAITNPRRALLRDALARAAHAVPAARKAVTEMRFKPLPRYEQGVVCGPAPAGTMFPQPEVVFRGKQLLFDDAFAPNWTILTFNAHVPVEGMDSYRVVPARAVEKPEDIGDLGALQAWFDRHRVGAVVLRPDRYVAAACTTVDLPEVLRNLRRWWG